jgi:hypothetical protein
MSAAKKRSLPRRLDSPKRAAREGGSSEGSGERRRSLPRRSSVESGERRRESPEEALDEFLKPYDPPVRALLAGLRALVRREVAPCHETIYDAGYTIALWYGASTKVTEGFCYISVHRRHVNLGFPRGSLLEDPEGWLRGDGPWMRHIQIKAAADLDRPELPAFLRAACAEADHSPSTVRKATVLSIVKRSQARKRRPR